MTETQLKTGKDLQADREAVYDQMKQMKSYINECKRLSFATEDPKEDYDAFKHDLLMQCDAWVEEQRKKIDEKFKNL